MTSTNSFFSDWFNVAFTGFMLLLSGGMMFFISYFVFEDVGLMMIGALFVFVGVVLVWIGLSIEEKNMEKS